MKLQPRYWQWFSMGLFVVSALYPFQAYSSDDLTGKQVLRDFILSSHTLKKKVPVGKIIQLSLNRAEVYAEEDGLGYAVVAFQMANKPSSILEKLCSIALTRKYLRPVIADLRRRNVSGTEMAETLKIYSSKVLLKGVEHIGQKTEGRWTLYGCKVPLEKVETFEYSGNPMATLALANYGIAKSHIRHQKYNSALKSLGKTTSEPNVYKNAVAFIVPILATRDTKMAAKVEDKYLDLNNISDTDALQFFGIFLVNEKRLHDALLTYERCVQIASENKACQQHAEDVRQKIAVDDLREAVDFNAFFVRSPRQ